MLQLISIHRSISLCRWRAVPEGPHPQTHSSRRVQPVHGRSGHVWSNARDQLSPQKNDEMAHHSVPALCGHSCYKQLHYPQGARQPAAGEAYDPPGLKEELCAQLLEVSVACKLKKTPVHDHFPVPTANTEPGETTESHNGAPKVHSVQKEYTLAVWVWCGPVAAAGQKLF